MGPSIVGLGPIGKSPTLTPSSKSSNFSKNLDVARAWGPSAIVGLKHPLNHPISRGGFPSGWPHRPRLKHQLSHPKHHPPSPIAKSHLPIEIAATRRLRYSGLWIEQRWFRFDPIITIYVYQNLKNQKDFSVFVTQKLHLLSGQNTENRIANYTLSYSSSHSRSHSRCAWIRRFLKITLAL